LLLAAAEGNFDGRFSCCCAEGVFRIAGLSISDATRALIDGFLAQTNCFVRQKKRPDATEEASGREAYFVR
jgi:hypothetical protein